MAQAVALRCALLSVALCASAAHANSSVPPPVPLPPADRMAIAVDLWRVRPVPALDRKQALETAASYLSTEGLTRLKQDKREDYFVLHQALTDRVLDKIEAVKPELDRHMVQCLAFGLAYSMTVEQLTDLRTFVATPSGGVFWERYSSGRLLIECTSQALREMTGAAFEADVQAVVAAHPAPKAKRPRRSLNLRGRRPDVFRPA